MRVRNIAQRALLMVAVATQVSALERLVPAGSLVHCRVSERISSQTLDVGDPVVCQITQSAVFPYGSVLTGTFEDYKDPGHFIGKGWMVLHFERVLLPENNSLPVSAKVVAVKGYRTDAQGRMLGKGHPTRDAIEWMIPVLWPIKFLWLPARGPRPTLKPEAGLVVKLMEDVAVTQPDKSRERDQYGFSQRSSNDGPQQRTQSAWRSFYQPDGDQPRYESYDQPRYRQYDNYQPRYQQYDNYQPRYQQAPVVYQQPTVIYRQPPIIYVEPQPIYIQSQMVYSWPNYLPPPPVYGRTTCGCDARQYYRYGQ